MWLVVALTSCTSAASDECPVASRCPGARATEGGGGVAVPHDTCGDGVVDPGEECDDGSTCSDGRVCTDDRYRCDGTSRASCRPRAGDGCSDSCSLESAGACGGDSAGGACHYGDMPAPGLPLDDTSGGSASAGGPASSGAPATPGTSGGEDAGDTSDEPLDETETSPEPPGCEWGPFGEPEPIRGFDAGLSLWSPALAANGQTLFFAASPSNAIEALYVAKRDRSGGVSSPARLATLDSGAGDGTPFLSFDGLSLYFYTERVGDGDRDLWLATRPDVIGEFAFPRPLFGVNTTSLEHLPWLSRDELTLLFVSNRSGGLGQSDIWIATRPEPEGAFDGIRLLDGVNSAADEGRAAMSSDQRTIIYSSARDGGLGTYDLWVAARPDNGIPFGAPENLGTLNSASRDIDPYLSANERELWFCSDRDGGVSIWRSVRACAE